MGEEKISPLKQLEEISSLLESIKLEVGATWYLVSAKWFRSWKDYARGQSEVVPESIDNSFLLANRKLFRKNSSKNFSAGPTSKENGDDKSQSSSKDLRIPFYSIDQYKQEEDDYVVVPEKVWILLHSWYGGGPELPRRVIQEGDSKKIIRIEVFPLILQASILSHKSFFRNSPDKNQHLLPLNIDQVFFSKLESPTVQNHSSSSEGDKVTDEKVSSSSSSSLDQKSSSDESTSASPEKTTNSEEKSTPSTDNQPTSSNENQTSEKNNSETNSAETTHSESQNSEEKKSEHTNMDPKHSENKDLENTHTEAKNSATKNIDSKSSSSENIETKNGKKEPKKSKKTKSNDGNSSINKKNGKELASTTEKPTSSNEKDNNEDKSDSNSDILSITFEVILSKKATILDLKEKIREKFLTCEPKQLRLWNLYDEKAPKIMEDENETIEDAIIIHQQKIMIEVQLPNEKWIKDDQGTKKPENKPREKITKTFSQKFSNFVSMIWSNNSNGSTESSEGEASRTPRGVGLCGLDNLGNTCFMNSALQCLSNTPLLTEYFISGKYKSELNKTNPLGMKGRIAEEYGSLLKQIWSGSYSSIAPKSFKLTLGKFAPQFSGFNQHDSQELLAFLLDGLHEDLNRVKDKPAVPTREANGKSDEVVSKEFWDDHLKRNKSIIVDLFQGQLKSRLICPECKHVSITFDPFMYLSLPLPAQQERLIELTLVRNQEDGWESPVRYLIKSKKGDTVQNLKNTLATKCDVKAEDMVFADVYQNRIFKLLANPTSVSTIRLSDVTFAYQILTPKDDYMRIQIIHRKLKKGNFSNASPELLGIPMLISIKEETKLSGKAFYQIVWKKTRSFLKNLDKVVEEDSDGTPKKYPYTLHYVTTSGLACAKCETSEQCSGCEIELNDNPVKLKNGNSVGINWDIKILKSNFDKSFSEKIIFDSSMSSKKDLSSEKERETTIDDCLELFIQDEKLGPNDAWYCPKCKKFQEANKKFDLWKLPKVLVIHLKRFLYTRSTREKITSLISFPLEGLNMEKFVTNGEEKEKVYDLVSISNHSGGLGGGHYTAYAKNNEDKKWYSFNDSMCCIVDDPSKIVSSAAYVLIYQQKETK